MKADNIQPSDHTISGSFRCNACGATTIIQNQVNPMPFCKYCNAPLPELKEAIDQQYRLIQEQFSADKDLESLKLQLKQERILQDKQAAENRRNIKLEHQKELKAAKIAAETERQRLIAEDMERQRQHNRQMSKITFIRSAILIAIAIIGWLMFTKK